MRIVMTGVRGARIALLSLGVAAGLHAQASLLVGPQTRQSFSAWLTRSAVVPMAPSPGTIELPSVRQTVPRAPLVDVASPNPGANIERSACVTVSLTANAAYECGDLRLSYALPTIRVMNQARAATMLYNSQHAAPQPIVRAWIRRPVGGDQPNYISADLWITRRDGSRFQAVNRGFPAPASMPEGSPFQLAVDFDGINLPTDLYRYELTVYFWFPGGRLEFTPASGQLAIVNRYTSEFGRGWWVAGYEQLVFQPDGNIFWVGGDGSTRLYTRGGTTTNNRTVYRAAALAGPDSLTFDPADGSYRRHLARGAFTRFTNSGRHDVTVNAVGHVTTFATYVCGRLGAIQLPAPNLPAGQWKGWSFNYDTDGQTNGCQLQAQLRSSQASMAGPFGTWRPIARWTNYAEAYGVFMDTLSGAWFRHVDADTYHRRVSEITDQSGATTRFSYGAGGLLNQVQRYPGDGTTITHAFRASEAAALTSLRIEDSIATELTSPRDVSWKRRYWVTSFGSPWLIRDELGRNTYITPDDNFPLLAKQLTQPSGARSYASYDPVTGNVVRTWQDPVQPGQTTAPETRYTYQAGYPDNVESVTDAAGVVTTYGYADRGFAYPQLAWSQVGPDLQSRVSYEQCSTTRCRGLPFVTVSAADAQGVRSRDTLEYDVLGNLMLTLSQGGKCEFLTNDGIGRVVTAQTLYAGVCRGGSAKWVTTTHEYDVLDRVWQSTTLAPADVAAGTTEQRVVVRTDYNGWTSWPVRVQRTTSDGVSLVDSMRYDALGRVTMRWAQGTTGAERLTYDAAGNVTTRLLPRGDSVVTAYDALNRATRREAWPVTYASRQPLSPEFFTPLPWKPLSSLGATIVRGDVATFVYDDDFTNGGQRTGALRSAENADARTTRLYNPDGSLKRECQSQRDVNGTDVGQHQQCLEYGYDAAGRLTSRALAGQQLSYRYRPATGRIAGIDIAPLGDAIDFEHDPKGQLSLIRRAGAGITERVEYTPDGEVRRSTVATTPGGAPDFRDAALSYDVRGRRTVLANQIGWRDTLWASYTPMGHLASRTHSALGVNYAGGGIRTVSQETTAHDALGNLRTARLLNSAVASGASNNQSTPRAYEYDGGTGRIRRVSLGGVWSQPSEYDANGYTLYTHQAESAERADYYNALGQLVASDVRAPSSMYNVRSFNEYRYDALGRRIWMRSRRECATQMVSTAPYCNASIVRRTVWDGSSEFWETQAPGGDNATAAELEADGALPADLTGSRCARPGDGPTDACTLYGQVLYVHGQEMDTPLAVVRSNYRERFYLPNGGPLRLISFPAHTLHLYWSPLGYVEDATVGRANVRSVSVTTAEGTFTTVRALWARSYTPYLQQGTVSQSWRGSLVEDKREFAGGLVYRRNRYIDGHTGRFTQPDPIGLAGGLNSYGFAAGDPVNYSDPFGLAVCFSGDAAAVRSLSATLQQATNTTFTLDRSNCVVASSIRSGGDKSFGALRAGLSKLVASKSRFDVAFGREAESPQRSPFIISIFEDADALSYRTGSRFGRCDGGRAAFSFPQVMAHELNHHFPVADGKPMTSGTVGENNAVIRGDNVYNAAAGRPARCAY
jgi:RHS repeat-associated protein